MACAYSKLTDDDLDMCQSFLISIPTRGSTRDMPIQCFGHFFITSLRTLITTTKPQKLIKQQIRPFAILPYGLWVVEGQKVVEVKPLETNKGKLIRQWATAQPYAFLMTLCSASNVLVFSTSMRRQMSGFVPRRLILT